MPRGGCFPGDALDALEVEEPRCPVASFSEFVVVPWCRVAGPQRISQGISASPRCFSSPLEDCTTSSGILLAGPCTASGNPRFQSQGWRSGGQAGGLKAWQLPSSLPTPLSTVWKPSAQVEHILFQLVFLLLSTLSHCFFYTILFNIHRDPAL